MDRNKCASQLLRRRYMSTSELVSRRKGSKQLEEIDPPGRSCIASTAQQPSLKLTIHRSINNFTTHQLAAMPVRNSGGPSRKDSSRLVSTIETLQTPRAKPHKQQGSRTLKEKSDQFIHASERLTIEISKLHEDIGQTLERLIAQKKRNDQNDDESCQQLKEKMKTEKRIMLDHEQKQKLYTLREIHKQKAKQKHLKLQIAKEINCLMDTIEQRRSLKDPLKLAKRFADSAHLQRLHR